jgi:hypothetical protein
VPHEAETCSKEDGLDESLSLIVILVYRWSKAAKEIIKGMQQDAEIQYKDSERLIYPSPLSPLSQPLFLQFVILPWCITTQIKHRPSIENVNSRLIKLETPWKKSSQENILCRQASIYNRTTAVHVLLI